MEKRRVMSMGEFMEKYPSCFPAYFPASPNAPVSSGMELQLQDQPEPGSRLTSTDPINFVIVCKKCECAGVQVFSHAATEISTFGHIKQKHQIYLWCPKCHAQEDMSTMQPH